MKKHSKFVFLIYSNSKFEDIFFNKTCEILFMGSFLLRPILNSVFYECNSMQNNTFQCDHLEGDRNVAYQYVTDPKGGVSQFCCSCHERFRCHFLECNEESPGRCLTCRANISLAPSILSTLFILLFSFF